MQENQAKELIVLHFNDVYNIEEGQTEPIGSVARFKTALESFADKAPLILFSGDLFQPSLSIIWSFTKMLKSYQVGTLYKGEQMIKPMNDFKVDVACLGNHEFVLQYSRQ